MRDGGLDLTLSPQLRTFKFTVRGFTGFRVETKLNTSVITIMTLKSQTG